MGRFEEAGALRAVIISSARKPPGVDSPLVLANLLQLRHLKKGLDPEVQKLHGFACKRPRFGELDTSRTDPTEK